METPGAGSAPAAGAGAPNAGQPGAAPAEGQNGAGVPGQPVTSPAPVPSAQKYKFKFQVDGKDVEEEYDEATLRTHLQKAKGADKRFQEANEMSQKATRLFQLLKEDPMKVLQHPQLWGDKTRAQIETWLWQQIQREQMDPKEREALANKEELERLRNEQKEAAERQQKEKFESMKKQYAQQIDKEIVDAIKEAGQQVTPYFFKRVAHYMLSAMQQGKQVSPKDVIPLVKEDLQSDLRSMFESSSEDAILSLLNSDKAWENVRKADLKRLAPKAPPAAPADKQAPGQVARDANGQFKKKELNIGKRTPFDY